MAPFGFGKKQTGEPERPFVTDVTDEDDLQEVRKIRQMLNPNEELFVVARQSKLKPGGFCIYS